MDNATRRQLLQRHRQSGFPGSILDVYRAYDQGIDLIGQFEQQNNIQVARTPEQQQQGLRPAHQAGDINRSMVFPDVPPNTPFNTVGMKAPINIQKFDEQGHLVKSYENVPPGIQSLPTGPQRGTVIETPAQMQTGGIRKAQAGLPLTLGQTSPDWEAAGPGLRIDGQTYQNSQLTGATRVPLNPETGDQLPIMLPAAEVVGRRDYNDSITEAVSRTNSGLLGSQTSAQDYAQMENAVRSGINTAGNNMLAAAGDVLSSPQRYAVNAPLAYAMGKTPNLSMFPSGDRNLGINQPNAFPSETLGVTNSIGAFAVDALTDPTVIAGIGALGKVGVSRAKGLLRNAAGDVNQNLLSRSLPSAIEQTPQRQAARSQEWMQNWFNSPETQRRIDKLVPENAQMSSSTQGVRGHMKGFEHDITLIDDETRGLLNTENTKMGRSNPGYSSVHYPQHRSEGSVAFPNQTVLDPKRINNLGSSTIHELTHSVAPSEFINAATTSTTLGRTSTSPGVKGTDIFRRHLTPQAKSAEDLYQQGIRKTGWADAGYMSDPTEQHARIMQLRHMGNLKPGQQVTASTIENLRNQNLRALGSGKEVVEDQFFDIYSSPARMADMFNNLPGLAPIAGGALATGTGIGLLNDNTAVSPQMKAGGVRKLQAGTPPKWDDTIQAIGRNWGPDQLGDTLDLNTMDLISEERMGVARPGIVRDSLAYHETGPHQRMQPNAVQIAQDTITGKRFPGVGRGLFMYDQPSTLRDANRLITIADNMGMEPPAFATQLKASDGTSRADTLSADQQHMLMTANLIADEKAPFKAYGRGDASLEDLWYSGVNRRPSEEKARAEFRESMRGLEQDDLSRYFFMGPRPNYFERRRRGGLRRRLIKRLQ